jgi:hypothetical protein
LTVTVRGNRELSLAFSFLVDRFVLAYMQILT